MWIRTLILWTNFPSSFSLRVCKCVSINNFLWNGNYGTTTEKLCWCRQMGFLRGCRAGDKDEWELGLPGPPYNFAPYEAMPLIPLVWHKEWERPILNNGRLSKKRLFVSVLPDYYVSPREDRWHQQLWDTGSCVSPVQVQICPIGCNFSSFVEFWFLANWLVTHSDFTVGLGMSSLTTKISSTWKDLSGKRGT